MGWEGREGRLIGGFGFLGQGLQCGEKKRREEKEDIQKKGKETRR